MNHLIIRQQQRLLKLNRQIHSSQQHQQQQQHGSTQLQSTDLVETYRTQITLGNLKQDVNQTRVIYQLQPIHKAIKSYIPHPKLLTLFDQALLSPPPPTYHNNNNNSSTQTNINNNAHYSLVKLINKSSHSADLDAPLGFLLTGPPGTGKTLIMDLFFDSLPIHQKFRRHYHHFLLSLYSLVSQRLERSNSSVEEASEILSLKYQPTGYLPPTRDRARNKALSQGWRSVFAGGNDPKDPILNGPNFVLAQVARDLILNHGWILAFDEIQMVDVAGAGIMSRVLEWYWRLGGVVIGTSNRLPEHMYDQGVHKSTVAPFLDRLKTKSPVVSLDSQIDWRMKLASESLKDVTKVKNWYQNVDPEIWKELVSSHVPSPIPTDLVVYGRNVIISRSNPTTRSAIFTYQELCETALGPADYLKICSSFETIMIEGLPIFTTLMKNEARRLITFVDAAYECSVKLYVESKTSIDQLFFPVDLEANERMDVIERETLADMMEELSEPFRPNVSDYRGKTIDSRPINDTLDYKQKNTKSSIDQLAIFSGKDEKYAFDRAISRLRELTMSGGRISKSWSPVDLDLNHLYSNRPQGSSYMHPSSDPHQQDINVVSKQEEEQISSSNPHSSFNQPPQISHVHFWGIASWGKRAGRWGQGVHAFINKKK